MAVLRWARKKGGKGRGLNRERGEDAQVNKSVIKWSEGENLAHGEWWERKKASNRPEIALFNLLAVINL